MNDLEPFKFNTKCLTFQIDQINLDEGLVNLKNEDGLSAVEEALTVWAKHPIKQIALEINDGLSFSGIVRFQKSVQKLSVPVNFFHENNDFTIVLSKTGIKQKNVFELWVSNHKNAMQKGGPSLEKGKDIGSKTKSKATPSASTSQSSGTKVDNSSQSTHLSSSNRTMHHDVLSSYSQVSFSHFQDQGPPPVLEAPLQEVDIPVSWDLENKANSAPSNDSQIIADLVRKVEAHQLENEDLRVQFDDALQRELAQQKINFEAELANHKINFEEKLNAKCIVQEKVVEDLMRGIKKVKEHLREEQETKEDISATLVLWKTKFREELHLQKLKFDEVILEKENIIISLRDELGRERPQYQVGVSHISQNSSSAYLQPDEDIRPRTPSSISQKTIEKKKEPLSKRLKGVRG